MKSKTILLLVITLLVILFVFFIEKNTHVIRKMYDNVVLDNVNHYLSCDQLPTRDETKKVVQDHRDVIERIIKEIGQPYQEGGEVRVNWDEENMSATDGDSDRGFSVYVGWGHAMGCEDSNKAELFISYGGHAQRMIIQRIINSPNFFGIPYRLMNT